MRTVVDIERYGHRIVLRALRMLWDGDVDDAVETAAILTEAARRLDALADQHARAAVAGGIGYGKVGRALQISRQAARRRYQDEAA